VWCTCCERGYQQPTLTLNNEPLNQLSPKLDSTCPNTNAAMSDMRHSILHVQTTRTILGYDHIEIFIVTPDITPVLHKQPHHSTKLTTIGVDSMPRHHTYNRNHLNLQWLGCWSCPRANRERVHVVGVLVVNGDINNQSPSPHLL
jgi:hypothetical protein